MPRSHTVFDEVVQASAIYLGPVAERFMRRQIVTHLGVEPEKLKYKDIPQLVDWTKLAFAMLTDNDVHIRSFSEDLLAINVKNKLVKHRTNYAKNS